MPFYLSCIVITFCRFKMSCSELLNYTCSNSHSYILTLNISITGPEIFLVKFYESSLKHNTIKPLLCPMDTTGP